MPDIAGTTPPETPSPTTFWERLTTLGVKGLVTVGAVGAWIIMLFTHLDVPKEYVYFVFAMSGWLGLGDVLKGLTKLGK